MYSIGTYQYLDVVVALVFILSVFFLLFSTSDPVSNMLSVLGQQHSIIVVYLGRSSVVALGQGVYQDY